MNEGSKLMTMNMYYLGYEMVQNRVSSAQSGHESQYIGMYSEVVCTTVLDI